MRTTNTENIFHVEGFTSHLEVAVRAISNLSETFHQRYTNIFFRTLFLLFTFYCMLIIQYCFSLICHIIINLVFGYIYCHH
jgi:hypothetical protein